MRTQEEVVAQCEARYAEIVAEAEKPERKWPCGSCRWRDYMLCAHPLIKGHDGGKWNWDTHRDKHALLCGPEKALWEAKPSRLWCWWPIAFPVIVAVIAVLHMGFPGVPFGLLALAATLPALAWSGAFD